MGVDHHALDIRQLRVVLKRAHIEPRPLAQLRDPRVVVVREAVRRENGVGHLRVSHQVHFDHFRLQRTFFG